MVSALSELKYARESACQRCSLHGCSNRVRLAKVEMDLPRQARTNPETDCRRRLSCFNLVYRVNANTTVYRPASRPSVRCKYRPMHSSFRCCYNPQVYVCVLTCVEYSISLPSRFAFVFVSKAVRVVKRWKLSELGRKRR